MAFILSRLDPASINLYLQTCQKRECERLAGYEHKRQRLINMHIISIGICNMMYIWISFSDETNAQ